MRPVKVYYSGPIRGYPPDNSNIPKNIEKGKILSQKIQSLFGELVDIYSPHLRNDLIHILYTEGKISVQDILNADLAIQSQQEMTIADVSSPSEGVELEINNALKHNQVVITFNGEITDKFIKEVLNGIQTILEERESK